MKVIVCKLTVDNIRAHEYLLLIFREGLRLDYNRPVTHNAQYYKNNKAVRFRKVVSNGVDKQHGNLDGSKTQNTNNSRGHTKRVNKLSGHGTVSRAKLYKAQKYKYVHKTTTADCKTK